MAGEATPIAGVVHAVAPNKTGEQIRPKLEPQPLQPSPQKLPLKVDLQAVKVQVEAASSKPDKSVSVPKYQIENFSGESKEK